MRKINLIDAVRETIMALLRNGIDWPEKKDIIVGYNRKEVRDDTELERNDNITMNNSVFNYFIVRKSINFYVVKIKHYAVGETSYGRSTCGGYKWCKTILTLGIDRVINALIMSFNPIGLLETSNHMQFTVYSSDIERLPGALALGIVCCTGLWLFIDPIDIHDAVKGKNIDRTYFNTYPIQEEEEEPQFVEAFVISPLAVDNTLVKPKKLNDDSYNPDTIMLKPFAI